MSEAPRDMTAAMLPGRQPQPDASRRAGIAVITFNDIPPINHSVKYEVLGRMALENRRRYCELHGYDFISEVPIARDRPACWAKIPAILDAFRTHEWVLWADSDTLIAEPGRTLEPFRDPDHDLIVQTHDRYYRLLGISPREGLQLMPINTGVFLIRASDWSRDFLRRAYARTAYVSRGEIWDGIGEQEAMIELLRERPEDRRRIAYVDFLQAPPRFYRPGYLFIHFYGNHARHRIPAAECMEVLTRWQRAIRDGAALPEDRARFHWCCVQSKDPANPVAGGDLARYFYRWEDIVPARPA